MAQQRRTTKAVLTHTQEVLLEVLDERKGQDEKWGKQDHPMHGGKSPLAGQTHYYSESIRWRAIADKRHEEGIDGWDAILLEECYEALAETDEAKAREELIQVAAVAVAAVEAIDRRAGRKAMTEGGRAND